MSSPTFIHLRVHTEYSLLEGAMRLKKLSGMVKDMDMPAVAVTDTNNLFCALEFSEYSKAAGIQPIIGCQVDVAYHEAAPGERQKRPAPVVLLAQSETGYENLMKLNSCLYVDKHDGVPQVTVDELEQYSEGLICLTGGSLGPVGKMILENHFDQARALLERFKAIYPNRLYVELQRHPGEGGSHTDAERLTERPFVEWAYEMGLPLVATNDAYFPKSEMYEAHDALICIAEGAYVDQVEPRRRLTPQHYFKSPSEMAALFADLPEAIENTVEIAKRCAFKVYKRAPILPKFADDEVEELRKQAWEGLDKRLAVIQPAGSREDYEDRLKFELGIIEQMGFPGYFLIVADFIKWSKDHGIPVGPGRGSGAGSLVAYCLTITDLDPLRYSLLFERFLNPERVSMPDFDIDFCMDRREETIRYVQEKYGRDKVGQIITFGALLSKAAVRDIGRVLQMPYGQVDRLSKLIPVEGVKPVSIKQALEDEPKLREEARNEEVVDRLLTYGQQVEGLLRNASTHAAGVVIGDRPLDHLVPLYQDPRSDMPATQFNMKWVEQAGLVKFDFLGLKTLTVIQSAMDLIFKSGRPLHVAADGTQLYEPPEGGENQINLIPLDDEKTYKLYSDAKTVAVFQVESSGMMQALRQMKPTCIEDIVALVALYRPGPMENIPTYCDVKHGRKELESVHPTIDHILAETQGIIVYQEQVMQIAQVMAGYSLGGADLLRRAMGKKIKEAMDAERPKFEEGAAKNGVDKKKASEVFDLLEKFANYGFNKSHAAAYAVVSYQTGWLKANHPVEFMAGVMNCDIHLTDKLSIYAEEVKRGLGIEIIPPCVNRSLATFDVVDQKLVYALGALKNVGGEAMQLIVRAREEGGKPFVTLFDFARRVDLKKVGKRPLEMLARAGAFDQLDSNRRRVFESLDSLVQYSAAIHEQKASNQVSLFGDAGEDLPEPRLSPVNDWVASERLMEEHKAIGFYLSGHPLDDYASALKRKKIGTIAEVQAKAEAEGGAIMKVGVLVSGFRPMKSGKGTRYFRMNISDSTGQLAGIAMFPKKGDYESAYTIFENHDKLVVTLEGRFNDGQFDPMIRSVAPMDTVVADAGGAGLKIYCEDASAIAQVGELLTRITEEAKQPPKGAISFCIMAPDYPNEVDIDVPKPFVITPEVKGAIKSFDGVIMVEDI
ncbi:DNA polymerase III subunit alpha [Celeribacter halophilus]|uniref:DNA polymerase III subunit alpha n=1 Tax=Celeribacter halophilus TaxID=576117 RepID=A0A1I3SCA0_9RHOB|nr:DNA polymerase III subunit alpha [Celeribacter halophilus]PZX11582.1 DNA polymerase-3 subunit alpha [Celeribacter halophilus]SFJ56443.1 DNA polymerase III, alpha subunit [Celeribacter halophilus]